MDRRPTAFRLPVLAQVSAPLWRAAPQLATLAHVADLISAFLDVSVLFTPARAASRGAPALFDRTLARVASDPSVDTDLRSHWLARTMEIAIQHNRLDWVQRIHRAHPEPLHVRSLQLALQFGTLEMAQWIVENRSDRLCCEPGVHNIYQSCLNRSIPASITDHDTAAIMDWFVSMGVPASALRGRFRNAAAARWHAEHNSLEPYNAIYNAITAKPPALDTLGYLIESGYRIGAGSMIQALADVA